MVLPSDLRHFLRTCGYYRHRGPKGNENTRRRPLTFTLLAAGQDPHDPRLASAIDFLEQADLRGLEINGRVAVFLSPDDLSTGLVGVPCDGVYGYAPDSATKLMANMLLYSAR